MKMEAMLQNNQRTILVVEDEVVNREMLGFFFEDEYNVLYAEDGVEALEILRENYSIISMVLLDINMPRMNGDELMMIMREDEHLSQIPVIVLTADKNSELEMLRIGALDFIPKPYDMPEIIKARVQRIIEFVEDKKIIRDVERDTLTNLYTGSIFNEYCFLLAKRNPSVSRDMLVLDMDHFRLVNELFGKTFGDLVLYTFAEGISEMTKVYNGLACRKNADVFYVLMEHQDDYEPIYDLLMQSLAALSEEHNLRVRLRMGVYQNVDFNTRSVEWYVDAAKSAADTIRSNFAANIAIYDDTLHQKELYHERLLSEMEQGLREKQFKVYFQPKYDIKGDVPRLRSAEALIRWIHPELGFISPGDFIPLFEKNGLIMKLDDYVWRESAAQIRDWQERYHVSLPVSVNLSRMDFFDTRLKERLLEIVEEAGITVNDLMLEVTESAVSHNTDKMLQTIRELRDAGFMIEMDDFGSGYSSLNMLCVMPIDALKIDMKFVQNIINTENGYRMVEIVVEMARSLSVPAIVEGVEDEDQCRLVKRAGCDIVQGYYFSRPVDAESFEELLVKDIENK